MENLAIAPVTCTACKVTKPQCDFAFKHKKQGSVCKSCIAKKNKEQREKRMGKNVGHDWKAQRKTSWRARLSFGSQE